MVVKTVSFTVTGVVIARRDSISHRSAGIVELRNAQFVPILQIARTSITSNFNKKSRLCKHHTIITSNNEKKRNSMQPTLDTKAKYFYFFFLSGSAFSFALFSFHSLGQWVSESSWSHQTGIASWMRKTSRRGQFSWFTVKARWCDLGGGSRRWRNFGLFRVMIWLVYERIVECGALLSDHSFSVVLGINFFLWAIWT